MGVGTFRKASDPGTLLKTRAESQHLTYTGCHSSSPQVSSQNFEKNLFNTSMLQPLNTHFIPIQLKNFTSVIINVSTIHRKYYT